MTNSSIALVVTLSTEFVDSMLLKSSKFMRAFMLFSMKGL